MGSLADVYVRIRGNTDALRDDTRRGGEEAGRGAGQGFHTGFIGMVKQAAVTAATLLGGGAILNLGKMGITAAADMQQATVAFTTLTGSAKVAQSFLNDLKKFAASTPFELPGLVDDARLLMGVGKSAKDVIPSLTAWGNAAGALGIKGEGFHRIMIALSQSLSAGKINAGDMNQMVEAGIPIWSLMAEATGKTVPELRKLSETGKLMASDVFPKLEAQMNKKYGGAMEAQSKTLTGVWSTLMDTIRIGMSDALGPVVPLLSAAIPKAAEILSGAMQAGSKATAEFIHLFGTGWKDGAKGAAGEAQQLGHAAHEVFDWLRTDGVAIVQALGGALKTTIDVIAGTVRWFNQYRGVAITLGAVIAGLVLVTKAHALAMEIQAAGSFLSWVGKITGVTKVWTAVQWLLNASLWANPVTWIVVGILALIAVIVLVATKTHFFQDVWAAVWGFMKVVGAWFAGPFTDFFKAAWGIIAAGALWLWHTIIEPVWHGIQAVVDVAVRIITSYFNLMAFGFRVTVGAAALWLWHNVIEPTVKGIAALALWLWDQALKPTFHGIEIGARAVGAAAMWLWHNAIEPAMKGIGAVASWVWNSVLSPTFNAVMDIVHRMQNTFREVFGAISGYISGAFSNAVGIVKGAINGVIGVINAAIGGVNSIIDKINKVPGVDFPHIPELPRLAAGGLLTRGGRVLLGERGAEVVDLPTGAAVYPHGTAPASDTRLDDVVDLLERLIAAVEQVAPGVGDELNAAAAPLRRITRAVT